MTQLTVSVNIDGFKRFVSLFERYVKAVEKQNEKQNTPYYMYIDDEWKLIDPLGETKNEE